MSDVHSYNAAAHQTWPLIPASFDVLQTPAQVRVGASRSSWRFYVAGCVLALAAFAVSPLAPVLGLTRWSVAVSVFAVGASVVCFVLGVLRRCTQHQAQSHGDRLVLDQASKRVRLGSTGIECKAADLVAVHEFDLWAKKGPHRIWTRHVVVEVDRDAYPARWCTISDWEPMLSKLGPKLAAALSLPLQRTDLGEVDMGPLKPGEWVPSGSS